MTVAYNLLVLSSYGYTVFTSLVVTFIKIYKNKANLSNFLKSYIYLIPALLLSILAICLIPFEEYDLLPMVLWSFAFILIYPLFPWGVWFLMNKRSNSNNDESESS